MINAVRSFVKYGNVDPVTTKATVLQRRAPLLRIEPAAVGILYAHLLGIRSALRLAFARYAGGYAPNKRRLSRKWERLRVKLPPKDPYTRLIRFIRWCDVTGIDPSQVDDEVCRRYFQHLQTETTLAKPKDAHRSVCAYWNRVVETEARWPQKRLTVPNYRVGIALPIATFPKTFRDDFEAWKQNLSAPAPFGPAKPLSARFKHKLACIVLRFASVLVREGFPVHKLVTLEDLTRIDNFRLGMARYWRRANQKPSKSQHETARTILALARHWVRAHPARLVVCKAS